MTTIALRLPILAADTQVTVDDVKIRSCDKIEILNKDTVFAAAGYDSAIKQATLFFRRPNWEDLLGTPNHPTIKKDLDAILIYKGRAYAISNDLYPDLIVHPFYAIGSGWKFAMAAMQMGLDAAEAVKFASDFDIYTGLPVRVLNVKEFLKNAEAGTRNAVYANSAAQKPTGKGKRVQTEEV